MTMAVLIEGTASGRSPQPIKASRPYRVRSFGGWRSRPRDAANSGALQRY